MVHGMSHPMLNVLCFYITTFQSVCVCMYARACVCVQCPMCPFSVVPWSHIFLACCSDIFWVIHRWFQLPLLLLVSLLVVHSTYTVFLFQGLYILESSQLLSWSHLLLLYILSPLCRVFTIIYLKQTMFLGYRVLQLFCIYNLCYM